MPIAFAFVFVFAALALIGLFVRSRIRSAQGAELTESQRTSRVGFGYTAVVAALGALALLFVASCNPVSTKNEGVETSFGKPVGHLHNGPHLTWPWIQVHEMDAAIQTDSYTQKAGDCLAVRIANQQTGCLDISVRWRICTAATAPSSGSPGCKQNAVDDLFRDYRTFNHVRDSLVTRELTAAANDVFAQYNPLDSVQLNTSANGAKNPLLSTLARRITDQMRSEIGGQIEVLNTIIPIVHFDDATQARINQLQQQVAQTRIAEQERATNLAKAKANNALAHSVDTSPNVLVAQCMTTLEEMVKAHQQVPTGFSCWPGGGVSAVIGGAGK